MSPKIDVPVISSVPLKSLTFIRRPYPALLNPGEQDCWVWMGVVRFGYLITTEYYQDLESQRSGSWISFCPFLPMTFTSLGLSFPTCKMEDSIRMISNFFSRSNSPNNHPTMSCSKQGPKDLNCNSRRWPSFEEGVLSVNHPLILLWAAAAGRVP